MTTPATKLPGSLEANRTLGRWLRFDCDGFVEIRPGKVEIGQGILTVLAQIAADELGVSLAQIRLCPATTAGSPNEGVTSGSLSVQDCGTALRFAAAEAREIYRRAAATKLGVAPDALRVEDGRFVGPGNAAASYWELADDALLDREATASVAPKQAALRAVAGTPVPRIDIPDKVFGRARFIHDTTASGTLHGRVVRPARPGATLAALDDGAARALPGVVMIVRDGDFLGVVAETERVARRAAELLAEAATWDGGFVLPSAEPVAQWLRRHPVETTVIDETGAMPSTPARTITRLYTKPFLAHASIGPSCAVARWDGDGLDVISHTQGIYNLRADLATTFAIPPERIVVTHGEGAGCYGHNGADDVALDAALLARSVPGRAVRVLWSRAEELAWSPMSPAMAVEISVDLDDAGAIAGWRHEIWSNGHSGRPGRGKVPTLLAASHLAQAFPRPVSGTMPPAGGGGADRNSVPAYAIPARRVVSHRVLDMPLRTSAMRGLGALANVFAIESMMDELAHARDVDPVAFRLALLPDPRARAVVERAAERAGWTTFSRTEGRGRGIAYARYKNFGAYCAVVAEVAVDTQVRVTRLVVAVDVGEVINPDGVANQIEGGAIQAASWVLKEAVVTAPDRIVSDSWETYPILTFSEVPEVIVEIVSRPDEKPLGAGEPAQGPVAGAIANAVFDALGVRVTELPLTPDRLVSAMM